ncbi:MULTISPECIES: molybdate ABC transporter substrate-binding protein [unclassified Moraxella]|uniref:molybdate ABC transporter substrate-binding protein n=1 Tax=unclassified Moraxella TaxID=2685852 RepID=UPI003AF95BE7
MKTPKNLSVALLVMGATTMTAHADVTVYAAASMTNALNAINQLYEQQYHSRVKTSYAGSAMLAKQIEQGAPADVFVSADTRWLTYLVNKGRISPKNVRNLLGNELVLIAPKSRPIKSAIRMDSGFSIASVLTGKLCTGNTDSVPVGRYAKQSLLNLGWWRTVQPRLVETEDVRGALNFVDRGECQLGIVYASDAKISKNTQVLGTFPQSTHSPIVYPIGLVKQTAEAQRYYQFLQTPQAQAIYRQYGFVVR